MKNPFVQCSFVTDGNTYSYGWIPWRKGMAPGWTVELIDPENNGRRTWGTIKALGPIMERDQINRGWNNNI